MLQRVWRGGNPSLHCWWQCKLVKLLWRTVWRSLKKWKIEEPHDHNPTLGHIYPEKNMARKDKCIPMFTAAWFTIAKTWKQPKCPLTEKWIKKMWYTHTVEYYSAIKNNEIMPSAAIWMDLECHMEWSKSDRGEISYDIPYLWNLKRNYTNELTSKQKRDSQTLKMNLWLPGGKDRDFGKVMYMLLYLKWITNKDLLYSTWNSAQCYVPAWMGREFGVEWVHVYVWLSPFTGHLKLPEHC